MAGIEVGELLVVEVVDRLHLQNRAGDADGAVGWKRDVYQRAHGRTLHCIEHGIGVGP